MSRVATLGRQGEAFVLSGRTFERYELRGSDYHRTHKLQVEYDRRHQRFHFEENAVRKVPTHWITALDTMARKVLPAQT